MFFSWPWKKFCRDSEKVISSDNVFFEKRKGENFLSVVVCTAGQMFAPIVDGKKWQR